jgi:hypothetical protein
LSADFSGDGANRLAQQLQQQQQQQALPAIAVAGRMDKSSASPDAENSIPEMEKVAMNVPQYQLLRPQAKSPTAPSDL